MENPNYELGNLKSKMERYEQALTLVENIITDDEIERQDLQMTKDGLIGAIKRVTNYQIPKIKLLEDKK
jgi:hypothetical protein